MATWLRQNTAVDIAFGPFLDETTGKDAETALTLSQADFRLKKNGGAWAQKSETTTAPHEENGWYEVSLNSTDTNTLGILVVACHESGALPVWREFMVVPANIYDSVVSGTDYVDVSAVQVNGSSTAATQLALSAAQIYNGTVDNTSFTATTTVLETSSITTAAADHWIGRVLIFTSGTLAGQATTITDYALSGGGRGTFTYSTVTSAPANGVSFIIV